MVVALAAVGGALAGAAPSGVAGADAFFGAAAAALVALAAGFARRWTWFIAAGAGTALAGGVAGAACGAGALAVALAASGATRPRAVVGATVGALAAQALLRLDDLGPHGASTVAAALAAAPLLASGYRHADRGTRARARRAAAGSAVLVTLGGLAYGLALAQARPALERGMSRLDAGLAAARSGDDQAASASLEDAAEAFGRAEDRLGAWWAAPAGIMPIAGHNVRAVQALAASAADVSRLGGQAATETDTEALTLDGGRVDLAAVRDLRAPLREVVRGLGDAEHRIDGADAPWLVPPVADRLAEMASEVDGARPDAELAVDLAEVLPAMLGDGAPTRWFVAFVTPVEARGRTGFLGNYAELTVTDGRLEMTRFGRAADLEAGGTPGAERQLTAAPADYLRRWGRFEPAAVWRNVTLSPDFPSVASVVAELYPQSGGQPVDGVISLDPVALAALLDVTGPVQLPGMAEPITSDNAADFLHLDQYVRMPDTPERVDALETLARTTFDRLTATRLPGPAALADTLGPSARGGHLHLFATAPEQQGIIERVGLDGALPDVDGDALAVVNNNAGGNKIDVFLSRNVDYEVAWDPATGRLEATATVTLVNAAPAEGLPGYVIGGALPATELPRGTNRTYLSLYSPWGLTAATLDGRPVAVEPLEERGRLSYSLALDVPPGGRRTLVFDLEGTLPASEGPYRLDVATQPLVHPDRFSLTVDQPGGQEHQATVLRDAVTTFEAAPPA